MIPGVPHLSLERREAMPREMDGCTAGLPAAQNPAYSYQGFSFFVVSSEAELHCLSTRVVSRIAVLLDLAVPTSFFG